MKSTDPSQDTLFRVIAITMVVTFVLVASTLLLDNLLDRTAFEAKPAVAAPTSASAPTQVATQAVRAVTVDEGEMYLHPSAILLKTGVISFVVTNNGNIH